MLWWLIKNLLNLWLWISDWFCFYMFFLLLMEGKFINFQTAKTFCSANKRSLGLRLGLGLPNFIYYIWRTNRRLIDTSFSVSVTRCNILINFFSKSIRKNLSWLRRFWKLVFYVNLAKRRTILRIIFKEIFIDKLWCLGCLHFSLQNFFFQELKILYNFYDFNSLKFLLVILNVIKTFFDQ